MWRDRRARQRSTVGTVAAADDVGSALVDYLRRRSAGLRDTPRLRSDTRAQTRLRQPVGICCIVRRALKRAGLTPEFKGAHLLRHSLATDLLRRGASLVEIGQFSVTVSRTRRKSMPKSISRRCARLGCLGQEPRHGARCKRRSTSTWPLAAPSATSCVFLGGCCSDL